MFSPPLTSSGSQLLKPSKNDVSTYYDHLIRTMNQIGVSRFFGTLPINDPIRFESELDCFFKDPSGRNVRAVTNSLVEMSMILFDEPNLLEGCDTEAFDNIYHRAKYLNSFLESLLAVFLLTSDWWQQTTPEKILKDILTVVFRLQRYYLEGTIVDKAKQLFGHVNRDLLVGSFLKQYLIMKRSRTVSIDIREHFLYSIDMMKKGLWVLPLKKKVTNVTASFNKLTSSPSEYHFENLYFDIALDLLPSPVYKRKDRAPSTKSSYEFKKGNGIAGMYAENVLPHLLPSLERFEAPLEPRIFQYGRRRGTFRYRVNPNRGQEFNIPWTEADLDANEKIYSELISFIHANCVDENAYTVDPWSNGERVARVTILDEANKNRFLTIQRWIFQNGARSYQKHALKNVWFPSGFSTHKDVTAKTLAEIFFDTKTGPIGPINVSIDYSDATNNLHPRATTTIHEKMLERSKVGGTELLFLTQMFHMKQFDIDSLLVDHPDYPTKNDRPHPHVTKVSKMITDMFQNYLQKCGQMMGNPLSFACLCVINLAVCIKSLLIDRGYYVEIDFWSPPNARRYLVTDREDNRRSMSSQEIRNLCGPCIINGDDGFMTGTDKLSEIHRAVAAGVGLILNELKTETDEVTGNINSVRFMFDREYKEVRTTGYVNLSLLFARNVKTGKVEMTEEDLGSSLTTLLSQSNSYYHERIRNYFLSLHAPVYYKSITRWIYNRDLRTKVQIQDEDLEVFPKRFGGLNIPVEYEVARTLSEEQLERRFANHARKMMRIEWDQFFKGLPGWTKDEEPPADRLHSYRLTIMTKHFVLWLIQYHLEYTENCWLTAGPISPNSITVSELSDVVLKLFTKRFRIAPLWREMWCMEHVQGLMTTGIDLSHYTLFVGDFSLVDNVDIDVFNNLDVFIDREIYDTLARFEGLFVCDAGL